MAAVDWANPINTTAYTAVLSQLKSRDDALATGFQNGDTYTNLPTNSLRFNTTSLKIEKWSGSAWAAQAVSVAGGGTGATTASAARTNLGLLAMATKANVSSGDIAASAVTRAAIASGAVDASKMAFASLVNAAEDPFFTDSTKWTADQYGWTRVTNDGTNSYSGVCHAKRVGAAGTDQRYGQVTASRVNVLGGLAYVVGAMIKGVTTPNGTFTVYAAFYGRVGTFISEATAHTFTAPGTPYPTSYTLVTGLVTAPAGAVTMEVTVSVTSQTTGTVYVGALLVSTALMPAIIDSTLLKDSGVTATKLATDAVTTTKILNGAVTLAKLESAANPTNRVAKAGDTMTGGLYMTTGLSGPRGQIHMRDAQPTISWWDTRDSRNWRLARSATDTLHLQRCTSTGESATNYADILVFSGAGNIWAKAFNSGAGDWITAEFGRYQIGDAVRYTTDTLTDYQWDTWDYGSIYLEKTDANTLRIRRFLHYDYYGHCPGSCVREGTAIYYEDGVEGVVENLRPGDRIKDGLGGVTTVAALVEVPLGDRLLYMFGNIFMSPDHPVFVGGEWFVPCPESMVHHRAAQAQGKNGMVLGDYNPEQKQASRLYNNCFYTYALPETRMFTPIVESGETFLAGTVVSGALQTVPAPALEGDPVHDYLNDGVNA